MTLLEGVGLKADAPRAELGYDAGCEETSISCAEKGGRALNILREVIDLGKGLTEIGLIQGTGVGDFDLLRLERPSTGREEKLS